MSPALRSRTLVGIVLLALGSCVSSGRQDFDLDEHARLALQGVCLRVMAAQSVEADGVPYAPLSVSHLRMQDEHGPYEVRLRRGAEGLELVSARNQDARVIATGVRPFALGEEPNGMDDNGNGLIDEPGFSVVRDSSCIRLRLALARTTGSEERVAQVETTLTLP